MLDTIIAIATPSTISGDKDFFHDYDRYRVTITNVDPKYKLHVTKYLVSNCKLSLHTATQLLSSLPSKLPGNFTAEESARLRGELVQLNAQVDVAQATPGQTELGIGDFSTQFYLPFINRITNHGR